MLALRQRNRRAVLRRDQDHDARRSGALFGARVGAVGGTYSIGCRARFCVPCSRSKRPPCLLMLGRPGITRVTTLWWQPGPISGATRRLPGLLRAKLTAIVEAIGCSKGYASVIGRGSRRRMCRHGGAPVVDKQREIAMTRVFRPV